MDSDVKQKFKPPRDLPNGNGEAELAVSREAYIELLVAANVTDPQPWPEWMQECAGLLARIREIEAAFIATHGKWDWELLDEDMQDKYDELRAGLNDIRYRGDSIELIQVHLV